MSLDAFERPVTPPGVPISNERFRQILGLGEGPSQQLREDLEAIRQAEINGEIASRGIRIGSMTMSTMRGES